MNLHLNMAEQKVKPVRRELSGGKLVRYLIGSGRIDWLVGKHGSGVGAYLLMSNLEIYAEFCDGHVLCFGDEFTGTADKYC